MDIGAAIGRHDPQHGGALHSCSLVAHVEEEFREQGLALSFSWKPGSSNWDHPPP